MKSFKPLLLSIMLFGGVLSSNAQTSVLRVYPKHGTVVATIHKPRLITHNRTNFQFADGVWYQARGRNYVVVAAPIGVKVRRLPRGSKVVVVNGRKRYKYKGVWYKKSGRHYIVVTV